MIRSGEHYINGVASSSCPPEVLANVTYFEKNAKRCPKCFAYVSKMKGCNQVCCFAKVDDRICGTVFDYDTMALDTARDVHCADYQDYVKKNKLKWKTLASNRATQVWKDICSVWESGKRK